MFAWFVQGLEKVMPQPVTREKQDAQVYCLLDRQRVHEHMSLQCLGLSLSSFEKTNPHDLLS